MRPYRLSIAGVLGLVAIAALGLAMLREADAFWAGLAYTLAVFALLVALTGASFADRGLRAFCGGFAIFCGGYLLLVFGSFSTAVEVGPTIRGSTSPTEPAATMTTTYLLDRVHAEQSKSRKIVVGDKVSVLWNNSYWPSTVLERKDGLYLIHYDNFNASDIEWVEPTRIGVSGQDRQHFLQVGHALIALLLGMLGGAVAVAFRRTRARRDGPEGAIS